MNYTTFERLYMTSIDFHASLSELHLTGNIGPLPYIANRPHDGHSQTVCHCGYVQVIPDSDDEWCKDDGDDDYDDYDYDDA